MALCLARHEGRMTLRELAERAGGVGVEATGQAISRVGRSVRAGGEAARPVAAIREHLSKTQM